MGKFVQVCLTFPNLSLPTLSFDLSCHYPLSGQKRPRDGNAAGGSGGNAGGRGQGGTGGPQQSISSSLDFSINPD